MNSYYSCLDSILTTPQAEQHHWINKIAELNNGKVVFYGTEEYFVLDSQPFILNKLTRTPNLNGVIFFTLDQFCYGNKINLPLMVNIIKIKLSIHFARENVSIYDYEHLKDKHLELISYFHCKKQNEILIS